MLRQKGIKPNHALEEKPADSTVSRSFQTRTHSRERWSRRRAAHILAHGRQLAEPNIPLVHGVDAPLPVAAPNQYPKGVMLFAEKLLRQWFHKRAITFLVTHGELHHDKDVPPLRAHTSQLMPARTRLQGLKQAYMRKHMFGRVA